MTRIPLRQIAGEYCTERSHPALPGLRDQLRAAVLANDTITIDRDGVRTLSVSFIDELIPVLAIELGMDRVMKHVLFSPPLEEVYLKQIQRGVRLRG